MATSEDAFAAANELFVDEDFRGALEKYSEAIELNPNEARFFLKRAVCHIKLGQYLSAVDDSDRAIVLEPKNANAWIRKGTAYFDLEEYASALEAFQNASELEPSENIDMWIRKCRSEIDAESGGVGIATSGPDNEEPVQASFVSSSLGSAPPALMPYKFDAALLDPNRIRYEWFQSSSSVTIEVFAKNVTEDCFSWKVEEKKIEVSIHLSDGKSFDLDVDLFDAVIPGECRKRIIPTKVELTLRKMHSGKWASLEKSEHVSSTAPPSSATWSSSLPVASSSAASVLVDPKRYPSSKPTAPDWDSLEQQIRKEEEEERPEGDAALNKLLKGIYGRSDEDTRRAMMKSYYESGGTVLSTNWKDVGSRHVDGTPPEGLVMKKWSDELHK